MFQTFLECNQPPDSYVAVPEGVDALKPHMKRKDISSVTVCLPLYSSSSLFIPADTCSGKVVFRPPTSFGSFL